MFRIRDPQESLWQSQFLVTPKKAKRLERSWAEVFRNEALPLIDEERFAPMYCVDNGRPNRAVQTVLGVHSSGPHHQDSGEAKIRESTAGVSRKPSSDGKARGCSSKHLCGLTAWNT